MFPTLRHGQLVLVGPLGRLRRGQVVLARLGEGLYLKRAVALPGDEVAVVGPMVWVNGEPVPRTGAQGPPPPGLRLREEVFLLSEAPDVGIDSRGLGPVPLPCVLGRALVVLSWPPKRVR